MDKSKDVISKHIVAYLYANPRASALDISQAIGEDARRVQDALIALDDNGSVIMKGGWYSLSEAERLRIKNGGRA